MRLLAAAAATVALTACGGTTTSPPNVRQVGSGTHRKDVRPARGGAVAPARAVGKLTDRQLAGQHVVFPFAGKTPPPALVARIRRGEAAGVLFLGGNLGTPAQVRELTRSLQRVPRPPGLRAPLLLMVDQEGGSVKRLPGAPVRSAPQMAATGRPSVARAEGRATARTLRAAGMNVDLAPVVDVVRPESALHGEGRGFGFSARDAARFGTAFAAGLGAGRVAATAKHFPGFGAAPANTDNGAVRIRADRDTLRRVDRAPFVAARRAGVPMTMLASAIYPALSPRPAVLSRTVVQRELRGRVGFRGVTISDDLAAPAFAAHGGQPGAAVGAARAGVDLLLFAGTYDGADGAARALESAIGTRRVDRGELEAGAARVMALRERLR